MADSIDTHRALDDSGLDNVGLDVARYSDDVLLARQRLAELCRMIPKQNMGQQPYTSINNLHHTTVGPASTLNHCNQHPYHELQTRTP